MRQQELVWAYVPYSDFSESKLRPALVVSNDQYNHTHEDIVICAVTSNTGAAPYSVPLGGQDLESGSLEIPSKIKADKIFQVHQKKIEKAFARIRNEKFDEVKVEILKLLSNQG